ncbi:MAG: molybdate ABC transporter permease subunit [Campylobacter sp.]|nr:molybdate ABC transporter permease subunit [Campylobacter sp.]
MIEALRNLDLTPFLISLKLSVVTTFTLFWICLFLAYFMAYREFRAKSVIESIISLPLVLPPSVLGFYLLVFLSPYSTLGRFFDENFGVRFVFNFSGLVIASCIYSLPFMFSPMLSGFRTLPISLRHASWSLGKGFFATLFRVLLPAMKPSLISAVVICFAHTMGEFGVVLMIGGSVSEQTKVASIAIYEATEILDFTSAHLYSAIMLIFSFLVLLAMHFLGERSNKIRL